MLNILNTFPDDIIEININSKNISGSLDFSKFTKLQKLNCSYNQITSLNNLPQSLITLNCSNNQITSLNNLPCSLIRLCCYCNKITSLDNLPESLQELYCSNKQITNYHKIKVLHICL